MERTILITGAAGNLGGAVLQKFAEEGFRIAAVDSLRSASKVIETDKVKSFRADLLDESGIEGIISSVFSEFKQVEMAVLTVGGFAMGNLEETSVDDFDKMYRLNFITAFNVARQVFLGMSRQDGGGQMVFIGSRSALHPELAKDTFAYSLTKSLVFKLAEIINAEGKSKNIRASVVIPSIIDTPQNRTAMPDSDFSKWVSPTQIAENIYHLSTGAGKKLRESIIKVYGDS